MAQLGATTLYIIVLAFLVTLNRIRKDFMELALRDQLTGIYNRLSFFEFAEKEVAKCKRTKKPMHLLMFDIDFFKKVNDTFGHAKGDLVLREISGLVQSSIRSYDILGRYGGEEFMVLMPDIDCENAKDVAERIRLEIECHEFEGVGRVTVSIGLAQYTSPESIESLIDRADQALYVAKETGRNRVCTWEHPNNEV